MSFNPTSNEEMEVFKVTVSNGASVSPAFKCGDGFAIHGFSWPQLRNSVSIRFLAAESATGTYRRVIRPQFASLVGVYQTAASAAGAVSFGFDLAAFKHMKLALSASLTSARTFLVFNKAM